MTGRGQQKPLPVIARSSCDEAIQSCVVAPGLLRFARNDVERSAAISRLARRDQDPVVKESDLVGVHRQSHACREAGMRQRPASFRSYMREHAPDFDVSDALLTHEEPENAYGIVRKLIEERPELRGIFVNGGGISGVLRAMRELPRERQREIRIVCRDIGPETRKGLSEGLITASLCHPVDKMSHELIDVMLHLVERTDTASIEQRIVPFDILTPESIWT
jgi:DNA-binding LacI/PurR family transcriptional regulator